MDIVDVLCLVLGLLLASWCVACAIEALVDLLGMEED
jgi:hypothetical protein